MFVEKIEKWEAVKLESASKEINRSVFTYASLLSLYHFHVRLLCKDCSFHSESLAYPCKIRLERLGCLPLPHPK